MISFDYSVLLSQYRSRYGGGASPATAVKAPEPPWSGESKPSELVRAALAGKPILDLRKGANPLKGAEADYGHMFALYTALDTLKAIAERADAKGLSPIERSMLQRRFDTGMGQVEQFMNGVKLDQLKLVRGDVAEKLKTGVAVKRDTAEYATGVVHRGDWSSPVAAFQGDVRFSMQVTNSANVTSTLSFDLAEMGGATRTIGAVVNYLNGKLEAAGVVTRFAREQLPTEPRTVQVGGKTVTLPAAPAEWVMKLKGVLGETVSFSAPDTADAIYMARSVGKLDPADPASRSQELMKIQTDVVTGTPPAAFRQPNVAHYVNGEVFRKTLDADISAVRASATHTDGSVYMLAEVGGEVEGQPIKGERDVHLLKYDSTGNLVFSRTLGAAQEANATSIAVAADGKVAIAGSVKGDLLGLGALETTLNAQGEDSFVTVFNAEGEELWSKRRGAYQDDRVTALSFADDGSLYVAGTAKSAMPGEAALGGADAWVRGYGPTVTTINPDKTVKTDAALKFTVQYGTTGADVPTAVGVNGTMLVVAGAESGRGVLRNYTLQATGDPTFVRSRDIGDLAGGNIATVGFGARGEVIIAGTTRNGALHINRVNGAAGGGRDAFVAFLDDRLRTRNTDEVTYLGGAGEDTVTSAVVKNGQVWIAGSSTGAVTGLDPKLGAKDGFLARIDPETGAIGFQRRFTGKDGDVAPSSIAIGTGGASVLDRLGLPQGKIDYTGSQLVTAASSARAGDRMYVKVGNGRRISVTLEANDTLKMLATKINRAIGFYGKAEVVKDSSTDPGGGSRERIHISAKYARTSITVEGADESRNLLEALGLEEGMVQIIEKDRKGNEIIPRGGKSYGLKLARDLSIDTKPHIKRTVDELNTAMNVLRTAYRELSDALNPKKPDLGGAVPAYLQAQIKNYQDGLNRLTGGG